MATVNTIKRRNGKARGVADQLVDGHITWDQAMRVLGRYIGKHNLRMRYTDKFLDSFDRRLRERGYFHL